MTDYIFPPFNEMKEADYARVGFMSGLEVHQQLLTAKKLYCRCPAGKYSSEFDAEILRHMRPTLSELGEYDGTALMEFKTRKNIIYRTKHETVCTYEMDDTPPFEINDEALDIALGIGMLYNSNMVDEIHIARKQYLDGSIPTGFQRTAIYCIDGKIPYKGREIDVVQMSFEEDSCREYSDKGHERIWMTDRLGMPLIETVTAPQMKTPQEVAEVCEIIRRAARSTGWVRTGMGASRQDVNVSVTGGTRIEIKGVPKIKNIPLLTYNEAMRQWNLLRLREELKKRGITTESFSAHSVEVTRILRKTPYQPVHISIGEGKIAHCVVLKGFKGILRWQTQTDTFFSREISDRVRVIACLTVLPNIIHSDSPSESISSSEWRDVRKAANAGSEDTLVIVWGSTADVEMACGEIMIRCKEATIGIPSETRQALKDGTNGFERILPGPQRMYPDTDLPPKKISAEHLSSIRAKLPDNFWEREKRYRKLNLPEDVIVPLTTSPYASLFESLVKEHALDPVFVSIGLIRFLKQLRREGYDIWRISEKKLRDIFLGYKAGKFPKGGLIEVLKNTIRNTEIEEVCFPNPVSEKELLDTIAESEKELEARILIDKKNKHKLAMRIIMLKLKGRINGSDVSKLLQKKGTEVKSGNK